MLACFRPRLGRGAAKEKKAAGARSCSLCWRRGTGEEEEKGGKYLLYRHNNTHRGATTPPRRGCHPVAASVSRNYAVSRGAATTPPEVAALLAIGRPPVAITATVSIAVVTAHRVTSRRAACACVMMTTQQLEGKWKRKRRGRRRRSAVAPHCGCEPAAPPRRQQNDHERGILCRRLPWGGSIAVPEKKTHIHTAVTCADEGGG